MWFNDWVEVRRYKGEQGFDLELVLSFRDGSRVLGPVILPYPTTFPERRLNPDSCSYENQLVPIFHVYPTAKVSIQTANQLYSSLQGRFPDAYLALQEKPEPVVRLGNIPHHVFESLDEQTKSLFVAGRYTEQARWKLAWPLDKVIIDPRFEEILPAFTLLNQEYQAFAHLPKKLRKKEYGASLEQVALSLSEKLDRIHPGNKVVLCDRTKTAHLQLASLQGIRFTPQGLSGKDVQDLPWCFIDTEKKFFAYEEAQNCHVAVLFKGDGPLRGEVHTTERFDAQKIIAKIASTEVDFHMFFYDTDIAMVQGAVQSISQKNPAVLVGHNIPYDIKELRQTKEKKTGKGFPIGLDDTEPVTKVALEFFKRMDCRGKIVIDTCRLARILDPHLPSFDLETVAELKKSITYQDFDALARAGEDDGRKALSTYVAHDVLALYHHVFAGPWYRRLDKVVQAARSIGVSLSEATHSSSCGEKLRDRQYFLDIGSYRQARDSRAILVRMLPKFRAAWPSRRDKFFIDLIGDAPTGRYEHVARYYLPLEQRLMSLACHSFPYQSDFFNSWFDAGHLDRLTLTQYFKGLLSEPWLHWFYFRNNQERALMLGRKVGLPTESLLSLTNQFWREYRSNEFSGKRNLNLDLIRSVFPLVTNLHEARRVIDRLQHARSAAFRFMARHQCSISDWEDRAKRYVKYLKEALEASGSRVIHYQSQWLFVQGGLKTDDLLCPVIPVGEVNLLKFKHKGEDRVVLKEHGGYWGVRINRKKPSTTTLHEARYSANLIDRILEGNNHALDVFLKGRGELVMELVHPDDLLFSVPKEPLKFQGITKQGPKIFTYEERDNGLDFVPNWEFYLNRFDSVVGRWLLAIGEKVPKRGLQSC